MIMIDKISLIKIKNFYKKKNRQGENLNEYINTKFGKKYLQFISQKLISLIHSKAFRNQSLKADNTIEIWVKHMKKLFFRKELQVILYQMTSYWI